MRFVTLKKFCEDTGFELETIRGYIKNGHWLKGREYVKPRGMILVDTENFEQWAEVEQESKQQARRASKSRLPSVASGAGHASNSAPRLRI